MLTFAFITLGATACSGPRAVTGVAWLPDTAGWELREVDEQEPPRWVAYHRDVDHAPAKEIRVIGIVNGSPDVVAKIMRTRLLDDSKLPDGMQRKILSASDSTVEYWAMSDMPWPLNDREGHERLRFSQTSTTGARRIEAVSYVPDTPPTPGTVRVALVENQFDFIPTKDGRSVVDMKSLHDMGGNFPNWVIYGFVSDFMVEELEALDDAVPAEGPIAACVNDERRSATADNLSLDGCVALILR